MLHACEVLIQEVTESNSNREILFKFTYSCLLLSDAMPHTATDPEIKSYTSYYL
jgi:hypothetical protein